MGKYSKLLEKYDAHSDKKRSESAAPSILRAVPEPDPAPHAPHGGHEPKIKKVPAPDRTVDLITLSKPYSYESEQFKKIRNSVLFPPKGKKAPKCVMVTSALPGEGKSTVAANLAVSIAQNINQHVLLVDCDMRIPTAHKMFGYSDVPGLSEYLADGYRLEDLLLKTPLEKLTILPGGHPPENPAELLSSDKMASLLKEVSGRYQDRYVILDSPPPKMAAESSVIARQSDGILVVVRHGSTPKPLFGELVELLGKDNILGVIMNDFSMRFSPYGKGYKHYKKYGKYYR
jgi:protein-tyrosine kinase